MKNLGLGFILALLACDSTATTSDSGRAAPQEAVAEVPEIKGRVSDHAGLLSPDERAELELLLSDFEARTQNEFAVLTVPSTGAETIEEFSLRVARKWGVGREGLDNGLLIVVARDDRKVRIEIGDGLRQGPIPDSVAQGVMDGHLIPAFAEGRWAEGLNAGLQALIAATDQE